MSWAHEALTYAPLTRPEVAALFAGRRKDGVKRGIGPVLP